jgi:hypothetical protein
MTINIRYRYGGDDDNRDKNVFRQHKSCRINTQQSTVSKGPLELVLTMDTRLPDTTQPHREPNDDIQESNCIIHSHPLILPYTPATKRGGGLRFTSQGKFSGSAASLALLTRVLLLVATGCPFSVRCCSEDSFPFTSPGVQGTVQVISRATDDFRTWRLWFVYMWSVPRGKHPLEGAISCMTSTAGRHTYY